MSDITFRATKYIRLSCIDKQTGDSITSKRNLFDRFIENNPDIIAMSEKVDDGVSGVIFDRPAFNEMISDIECGKINCVMVKAICP